MNWCNDVHVIILFHFDSHSQFDQSFFKRHDSSSTPRSINHRRIKKGNPNISISKIIISNKGVGDDEREKKQRCTHSMMALSWYCMVSKPFFSDIRISHDIVWFASAQHFVHASTAGNKQAGVVVVADSAEVDVDSSPPTFPSPPLLIDSIARAARIESTQETNAFCSIGHFSWHTLSLVAAVLPLSIAWVLTVEKGHIGANAHATG